jgi:hypothetical protein
METVAGRTYKVKRSEFPLSITVAPKNTSGNRATTVIVGHIREMKGGAEIHERDADVTDEEGVITYDIPAPQSSGNVEMVQTLLGFFATAEKDNARFEITIATAGRAQATTSIRRPTFNPGAAILKFQI